LNAECFVVTADCLIEVLSYSKDSQSTCDPTWYGWYGHVKLNQVVVWEASLCGASDSHRGVNIIVIDLLNCTAQEIRNFDTHEAGTDLMYYLHQVTHDSVIVGATADEPRRNLDTALPTLQELGVEVDDVQNRGSFAFIAQKGYPSKTVLDKDLTPDENHIAPAHLNGVIKGIAMFSNNCDNNVHSLSVIKLLSS